jgi:parallel beta-helix repeat protein
MVAEGNTVFDNPLWTGIDFHGAWNCSAHDNHVYNCRNGLLLQGSSGDGVDYSGANNSVTNNLVTTLRLNGGPSTITSVTRLGISVNGGHKIRHRSVVVRSNTIDGYGDTRYSSFALQHTNNTGVEISANKITNWRGYCCYSAYADGVIRGNVFGPPADPAGSACIYVAIGGHLEIADNRFERDGGAGAMYGVYINTAADEPYAIHGNDFSGVTGLAYAGHGGSRLDPRQIVGGRP